MALIQASRYRWIVLIFAFVAQFSNALATQALAPLAPLFQPELGLSKVEVGFFSSAVFAGSMGMLLMGGALADRFGVKAMMVAGQLVMGVSLLSISLMGALWQAVVLMVAAGVGGGSLLPAATKAIVVSFSPRARATAMGLKQAAIPAGGVLTAAVLPTIGLMIGWRYAVAAVGILILIGGAATAALFANDDHQGGRSASRGQYNLRASIRVVVRNRKLWTVSSISVLFVTGQLALATYLALFLEEAVLLPHFPDEGTRIVAAGGFLALCQAGGVFGRVFWGVVSDRVFGGRRTVVLALVGAIAAAMALAMSQVSAEVSLPLLAGLVLLYGATAIGWNGLYQTLMGESVEPEHAGTGVGMSMTMNQFGTIGGPPLFGFVVDLAGGYQAAWILMGCLAAAGSAIALASSGGEKRVV